MNDSGPTNEPDSSERDFGRALAQRKDSLGADFFVPCRRRNGRNMRHGWPRCCCRGGKLVGLFLYGQEPEPPPYPLTEETAAGLLGRSFRLLRDETVVAKSVAVYQGMEHWEKWEKAGG